MPLHVVMDVRRIRDFGIGTYIRNLTRALSILDRQNRYTLLVRTGELDEFTGLRENFQAVEVSGEDHGLLHNLQLSGFLRSLNPSLYHIPLNSVPWRMPTPYVLTIHDMSTLLFPTGRRDFRHMMHEARYRRGALRASRIITVSDTTRQDLESVLRLPEGRVTTIYSAPDPSFTSDKKPLDDQILKRYSIQYPYILYAGTIRPRKNIPRLIEAFAVVRQELAQHPVYRDLKLVVIGDEHTRHPAVRRAVALTKTEAAVRFLGFVPLDTLGVFYRHAELFAFPSLYEGFGLAPLEAMACGTPVVASDLPSLIEAVGEAVELVSPDNVFDIARGLQDVLLSPERRSELSAAGLAQAARFHWDQTARQVLSIYEEVANKTPNK